MDKEIMDIVFEELTTPGSLQIIRDIASDIWPKTFAKILSPKQISYMMKMMYAPEVMEKELASGYHFEIIRVDRTPAGFFMVAIRSAGHCQTPQSLSAGKISRHGHRFNDAQAGGNAGKKRRIFPLAPQCQQIQ